MATVDRDRDPGRLVVDLPHGRQRLQQALGRVDVVDLEVDRARRPDERVHRAFGDEPALVHDDRVGADLLHLGEDVARQQHGGAGLRHAPHELAHLPHLAGIEAIRRLVEHEHVGTTQQHARRGGPLRHALGVRFDPAVDGRPEIGDGQRLLEGRVGPVIAAGLPPQAQVAHPRQGRHEGGRLAERGDASQLVGTGSDAFAEEAGLPRGRADEAEEHAQARRRARAVRREQGAHLSSLDGERQVVDSKDARAEALGKSDDLDDGFGHRPRVRREKRGETTAASVAWRSMDPSAARRPRDAQRRRVYLAETPLPSSPLPGLDACARFVDRVVGTLWWHERFPERDLGGVPRLPPANGARQAFYREEETGPTITLPRRYRTKAVVLHEPTHWALGIDSGLPHHGRTFARVLLDAVGEFCGPEHAEVLAASYAEQRVAVGRPPRRGPDGRLHYGWDERLRVNKGATGLVKINWNVDGEEHELQGCFDGYERGSSILRCRGVNRETVRIPTKAVWAVRNVG